MTIEELKKNLSSIDEKKKKYEERINHCLHCRRELITKYEEENQPYPNGTYVRVKLRIGKVNRYRIAVIDSFYLDKEFTFKPFLKEIVRYDNKEADIRDGQIYYWLNGKIMRDYDEVLEINPIDPSEIKTLSCDKCAWLEAYNNTKGTDDVKLHCSICIDGKVYEEGRRACKRFLMWSWSKNGETHRQQLMSDKGNCSRGEQCAHECFSEILSSIAEQSKKNH